MSPYAPLIAFGALLGAAWLVTRTRVGDWMESRVQRREPQRLQDRVYALLRREVQLRGHELEALPYERLHRFDDDLAYTSKVVDGVEIYFNAEVVSVDRNGDLHVCVDANVRAPGWKWSDVLPSYDFKKRPDGTVYW